VRTTDFSQAAGAVKGVLEEPRQERSRERRGVEDDVLFWGLYHPVGKRSCASRALRQSFLTPEEAFICPQVSHH
jgi:hypothetical protein